MVICKRCQSENQDQTRFCTFCGGRLPGRVEPITSSAPGARSTASATTSKPTPPPRAATAIAPKPDAEAHARYVQKTVYQHFIKAKELIRERKLEAAIREFERALEVSPGEPTITEMMAKTVQAKRVADGARGEPPRPVAFHPASIGRSPAPQPPVMAMASAEPRSPVRKLVTDPWFQALTGTPSITPAMVLDLPTSERATEVAVTGFIVAGLAFFAWLLTL